jgi:phosphonopyruvate decarboxylase
VTGDVSSEDFVRALRGVGIDRVASVPCSYFSGVLHYLRQQSAILHLPAANEGSALAFAAGSWLGGRRTAVLAQNSGFGNMVNPLTSLLLPYQIPALVFVSMRGRTGDGALEPQHEWMGRVVPAWLSSLGIDYWELAASSPPEFDTVFAQASKALDHRRPAFLLLGPGVLARSTPISTPTRVLAPQVTRNELVAMLAAERSGELVVSTTGYLSRELFNVDDQPLNFYMQGSMGHAVSVGLGVALARPDRRVIVLDGDGALLMHLGSAAAVGHRAPSNLLHIVFNNGGYESTGGQPLGAEGADFAAVASGLGYRRVYVVEQVEALRDTMRRLLNGTAPAMLIVRGVGSGNPGGRASEAITLGEIATRFATDLGASG